MINSISFKGDYIKSFNIRKKDLNGDYNEFKAPLVELDPFSESDMLTMNKIASDWENLSIGVWRNMLFTKGDLDMSRTRRYYAITKQQENFDKLTPNDILCVAETVSEPDGINLKYLQVAPESTFYYKAPLYKGLGSSFINFLKQKFSNKDIFVNSLNSSIVFYKKMGFKTILNSKNKMIYKAI